MFNSRSVSRRAPLPGNDALATAADETMHYTALTQALGGTLPSGALSFGG